MSRDLPTPPPSPPPPEKVDSGTSSGTTAYAFLGPLIESRAELLVTFILDGALVAAAAFARSVFLWLLHAATGDDVSGVVRVLEVILDWGLITTALVIAAFDLAKRVKTAYRDFRA